MSLYTPVFPPLPESNGSRERITENSPAATSGKQRNYVELLRDIHLFLSTRNDVLSPPSRPNSPTFDHRVQKVKDAIQDIDIFNAKADESYTGKWSRLSQMLKLGCVRGRPWSVSTPDLCTSEEDTNWILPDEEYEWIEWEKKREEDRRLRSKTNVSQKRGDDVVSTPPGPQKSNYPSSSFAGPSRLDITGEHRHAGIPPTVLRAAKEKVRKWQASVASEVWPSTSSCASSTSTSADGGANAANGVPQRSRTLDFTVKKSTARPIVGKKGKGSVSQPTVRGGSTPITSRNWKTPKFSKPEGTKPTDVEKVDSKRPSRTTPIKDDVPKIRDVSETPYIPPSFPADLETSTPLPKSAMVVRAKPSPTVPVLATPPPSTPANPPDDLEPISAEPHVAIASSSQQPLTNYQQQGKRSRSPLLDGVASDSPVAPPAKRLRTTVSHNSATPISEHPNPMLGSGNLDILLRTPDNPIPGAAASNVNSLEAAQRAPLTPGKSKEPVVGAVLQDIPDRPPSPAKSVKSFFSAPDSDGGGSPMRANLLLESPVSPMLSYAQNPSGFLPQVTSTQMRKGSPTPGRANGGVFGMGYSSQFDIERHVDRVSELLERDVDFDGWLRDVRTVDGDQD